MVYFTIPSLGAPGFACIFSKFKIHPLFRYKGIFPSIRGISLFGDSCKKSHDAFVGKRSEYGMADQGTYRDVDDPHKAVVILSAENLEKAFEWFRSKEFQESSKVVGLRGPRDVWVAERRG